MGSKDNKDEEEKDEVDDEVGEKEKEEEGKEENDDRKESKKDKSENKDTRKNEDEWDSERIIPETFRVNQKREDKTRFFYASLIIVMLITDSVLYQKSKLDSSFFTT